MNLKILVLSDLHLDVNQKGSVLDLVEMTILFIRRKRADVVLIAGDLMGEAGKTLQTIERIENETGIPVWFVPGNHDLWSSKENTWKLYDRFKNHPSSLLEQPRMIGEKYVVIGESGWYDYGFKPDYVSRGEVEKHKKKVWNDSQYTHWGMKDEEVVDIFLARIREQLDRFRDKKVIFVNHFIPFEEYVVVKGVKSWDICNSFMGSPRLGELLDTYSNIEHIIFGHTHKRFGSSERNGVNVICNPLGYLHEWKTDEFLKELDSCSTLLSIPD